MQLEEVYIKPDGGDAAWVTRAIDSEYPFFANDVCCDCDQPATELGQVGVSHGRPIYWGQCEGCADESKACTLDAQRQAEYECER